MTVSTILARAPFRFGASPVLLACAGFQLAACRDALPAEPPSQAGAVAGHYTLTAYAGAALPVVLQRLVTTTPGPSGGTTVSCDQQLVSGTLDVDESGQFVQADQVRLVCNDGVTPTITDYRTKGSAEVNGTSVRLAMQSPASTPGGLVSSAIGVLTGPDLVITRRELRTMAGETASVDLTEVRYRRTLR